MSTNPLQRISDLEAQVAALTAENNSLKSRTNGNGNGHFDAEKLLDAIKLQIDRSGHLMREDFTGKLAALIAPYLKETMRECEEVRKRQDELEKKFEEHKKSVAGSAAEMRTAFDKMRKEAAKDFKAQRDQIQEDLGRVGDFSKWFHAELLKNAQGNNDAVAKCNLAVRACNELALKMGEPVERAVAHLDEVKARGEADIARAAKRLTATYDGLRRPFMWGIMALAAAVLILHLGFGAYIAWGNRRMLDAHWQDLVGHSEQQKKDIQGMLDEELKQVREAQIDNEIKAKMWDEIVKDLNPQQRDGYIMKLRDRVRAAGEKRLDEQMEAGYNQMNGKKK